MPDPYTYLGKPTGTPYTSLGNAKIFFDDANTLFDDSTTFFDGMDSNAYNNVAKPTGSSYTLIAKPI